ncbi:MAG: 5-carboxymethyl-2-hydroxymuconate isomerase [Hyphomicrobiales bacterium]|nr:MAG: 5-carboxymethyl-2-hydroxymuconate isomerase [Hyphomicrobiales bacterium]
MPHCIIEYSKNLQKSIEPSALISVVHQAAIECGLFEPDDIRSRAVAFDDHQIRADKHSFIHVTLRIMIGRSTAQKQQLSREIMAALETLKLSSIIFSVEICDIDQTTYTKVTL